MAKAFKVQYQFQKPRACPAQAFPVGLLLDGRRCSEDPPDYPLHAQESLDKLVQTILIPLYTHKKHNALCTTNSPLQVGFVKDVLPEIEDGYRTECAATQFKAERSGAAAAAADDAAGAADSEDLITDEEGNRLEKDWLHQKSEIMKGMAEDIMKRNILTYNIGERELLAKLSNQPLLKDGSTKLFFWNAGCQATKDPPKSLTPWRMKSTVDEAMMKNTTTLMVDLMNDTDMGILISGRNKRVYADVMREVRAHKPKLQIRERTLEPDEDQFLNLIRTDSNRAGTVDAADQFVQIAKKASTVLKVKSCPRRFTPGNTAFKRMGDLPVLKKDSMITVPHEEREKVFRGVHWDEKYSPGRGKDAKADEDEDSDEDMEAEEEKQPEMGSQSVLFWMEIHPKVGLAALLLSMHRQTAKHVTRGSCNLQFQRCPIEVENSRASTVMAVQCYTYVHQRQQQQKLLRRATRVQTVSDVCRSVRCGMRHRAFDYLASVGSEARLTFS